MMNMSQDFVVVVYALVKNDEVVKACDFYARADESDELYEQALDMLVDEQARKEYDKVGGKSGIYMWDNGEDTFYISKLGEEPVVEIV